MKKKYAVIVSMFAFAAVLAGGTIVANAKVDAGTKPGWGKGDNKHVHIGPPGQSVRP